MTRRTARLATALTAAALLLTACTGSGGAEPAAHPVFSAPPARQVLLALRHTQETGGAALRQTVTFTAGRTTAVHTVTGRVDFAGARGEASGAWRIAPGFPQEARDVLLGDPIGPEAGAARARYAVDPRALHYRAGSAGYWLRYEGDIEPLRDIDAVSVLRGTESAIGGTLLEVLGSVRPEAGGGTRPDGGRTYRSDFPLAQAMALFPEDLRTEFAPQPLFADSPGAPVPATVEVDAEGRITRVRADLAAVLPTEEDSALAGVTGLRVDLALSAFGPPEPALDTTPDGRVLDAGRAVVPLYEAATGDCADLDTGLRHRRLVTRVPCDGPHDVRITGQHTLATAYPGPDAARDRADEACPDGRKPGRRHTWSSPREWQDLGEGRVTCYRIF
ncbi:hypothetical protein SNE510_31290 [Streptomyces sp. NE5-10]|uniref:hypothetical protein n=1 Tax=Streptomyces sp. NE5-10 TaxID=2759674 RepID=UPI00190699D7|nr:hypothetical protein [Streptomyces sp. NE5-10]GHJ93610.1 hypothetical protein SNE510_31290 [Streptomyces sp. NE5-10]